MLIEQSSTTTPTRTKHGPRFPESLCKKYTSWKSSSSATFDIISSFPKQNGRSGILSSVVLRTFSKKLHACLQRTSSLQQRPFIKSHLQMLLDDTTFPSHQHRNYPLHHRPTLSNRKHNYSLRSHDRHGIKLLPRQHHTDSTPRHELCPTSSSLRIRASVAGRMMWRRTQANEWRCLTTRRRCLLCQFLRLRCRLQLQCRLFQCSHLSSQTCLCRCRHWRFLFLV